MYAVRFFLLLALAIAVSGRTVSDDILSKDWQSFKVYKSDIEFESIGCGFVSSMKTYSHTTEQRYSKVYETVEDERYRYEIFLKHKLDIITHNSLYELGQVSFELGVNEYSDLEHSEFIEKMTGVFNSINIDPFKSDGVTYIVPDSSVKAPPFIDWTSKGAVTRVKKQEAYCGSCWVFASTGALEGQHFRKTQKLIPLSEQNLVDCTRNYGNCGCRGGWMSSSFTYIKKNGGIKNEQSYPYKARASNCRYKSNNSSGVTVKGFVNIRKGDENALKMAVAINGPIAVFLDARRSKFHNYKRGIYYDQRCNPRDLNHAVLITGYGTTHNGLDFWIVKNSWGTSWGQEGYMLIARNKDNHCGIASAAIFPLV